MILERARNSGNENKRGEEQTVDKEGKKKDRSGGRGKGKKVYNTRKTNKK